MQFSNRTLEGNWFEDRFAPQQPSQLRPEDKDLRPKEPGISWLGSAGLPKPLNTIKRVKKWDTTGVLPQDGFNETCTANKALLKNPAIVKQQPRGVCDLLTGATYKLIRQENVHALLQQHRQAEGPWLGFNFQDPLKPKDSEQRRFQTTYKDNTGDPLPLKPQSEHCHSAGVPAKSAFFELRVKQKQGLLAAEVLRTGPDPQHNTEVQKAWVPAGDAGLRAKTSFNYSDELPVSDNETSLPVGLGAYAQRLSGQVNRRQRTTVTTAPTEHHAMGFR